MNSDTRNLVITIFISTAILIGWQYFYEGPRQAKLQKISESKLQYSRESSSDSNLSQSQDRQAIIDKYQYPSVQINTDRLKGSISTYGLRFDDLLLSDYKESVESSSGNVVLFSRNQGAKNYFAEFGWISLDKNLELPNKNTVWSVDKNTLTSNDIVTFTWQNSQNIKFISEISLDENYMFTITNTIKNAGSKAIFVSPYGLLFRSEIQNQKPMMIFHEGAIGVFDKVLKEKSFEDLANDQISKFESRDGGWVGFSDKYWLAAMIPDKYIFFESKFVGDKKSNIEKFQVDFVGAEKIIPIGEGYSVSNKLFAGAKQAKLLNAYSDQYNIALFDRAIDYGWFYFLTKPMFWVLSYLFLLSKNFGLAIILMTFLIKLLMFPVASKSYRTMQRMKELQPKVQELKQIYGHDHIKLNSEMMELYKKEKLSPMSGCFPLFIQIPVFFSLYKVIFISIEMRHAPFYGWIRDLSAPDPTSLFNLFGLIPWNPPAMLMLGAWPIIMGITMYLQQRMNPEPADPVQAKIMKFLPFVFVFMFQSFPAGLMIYWSSSNILSIIQQVFIKFKHEKK